MLPEGNMPWPPPAHAQIHREIDRWSAWYTGDPDELAGAYGGDVATPTHVRGGIPHRGGVVGAASRMFWGQPIPAEQQSAKLHLPAASDIADTGAKLVFGEPPRLKVDDKDTATQDRLDELFDERVWMQLLEAGGLQGGLGGVFLRIGWEQGFAKRPMLSVIGPDLAVPRFRWGQLVEVTFTWVLERADDGTTLRHLEQHTPGKVEHALYLGGKGGLGRRIPLTEHENTRELAKSVGDDSTIPTGLTGLDVRFVRNRAAKKWRKHQVGMNLGQPDIAGVEPLFDALDETYTSWMRDVRLGKARIIVPQNMLESAGRGLGSWFNLDQELFVGVKHLPGAGEMPVEMIQPAIRFAEHAATAAALLERCVDGSGYSAQTFGLTGDVAMTATESNARERKTDETRSGKIQQWNPELGPLAESMLALDVAVFHTAGVRPQVPRIEWPPRVRDSMATLAGLVAQLGDAASTEVKVRTLHPDWDEPQILAEVEKIAAERALLTPIDPYTPARRPARSMALQPDEPAPADPAAALLRVYSDAEHELLASMAAEVNRAIDDPAEHRDVYIRKVRDAAARIATGLEHGNRARVRAVLDKAAGEGRQLAAREIARATGRRRAPADEPLNLGALDQLAQALGDQLTTAHRAILRTTPDIYRQVMERATVGLALNTQTRRQAAQRAMWEWSRRGVTSFTDRAGRTWELSSYAEMATRTAGQRAQLDAQIDRWSTAGHDLVMVSDHHQECALCRPWEGEVLSISGKGGGRPSVARARAEGLFHPNCRHALRLYIEGVTQRPTGPGTGPDPEGDQARQRQRAIERQIRQWKRAQSAALDTAGRRYAAGKVRAWQVEMREHLDQNPTLKRLPYRESPGAGNLPTAATYRDNPDGPFPERALRPVEMSDEQLDDALTGAIEAEDFDRLDVLEVEADRRDQQKHADEARRAAARDRAQLRRERDDEAKAAEYERLLEHGLDDEEAVAQVYGISVVEQRRRAAVGRMRSNGLQGRSFDELSRLDFKHRIWADYGAAEDATNGHMLNSAGRRAGIDPKSLFTGPETRARKYASDELLAWWDTHCRLPA